MFSSGSSLPSIKTNFKSKTLSLPVGNTSRSWWGCRWGCRKMGGYPSSCPGDTCPQAPPHPWWLSSSNCFCLLRAQVSAQPGLLLPPPGQEQKATGPCLHPRIRGRGSQKVDAASTARFGDELGVWDTQAQLPWRGLSSHCREESRALPAPCSRLLLETNYNTCISKIGNP